MKDQKSTRRTFLVASLASLGAILGGGWLYTVFSYLVPPSKRKTAESIKIPKSELPPGGMKRFYIRGTPAVVVNSRKGLAAFSLICSHLGCLVKWEGDKNEFICPCHGARFDEEGNVVSGPPPKGLERLQLSEQEGEVWVS